MAGEARRLVNLRDLGGLPVAGGRRTRPGVLYRSDAPYPGDARPDHVPVWPPAAVLDLRSHKERAAIGHEWPEGTILHHGPLHRAAAPGMELPPDLAGVYTRILDTVPERVASVLAIAARSNQLPLLVHCAAGKDRTGIVVATLLLAAGVEPEAIVADYLLTAENMSALRSRWRDNDEAAHRVRREIPEAWLRAPEPAIRQVVDRLVGWPGGTVAWLVHHGARATEIDSWRAIFVE